MTKFINKNQTNNYQLVANPATLQKDKFLDLLFYLQNPPVSDQPMKIQLSKDPLFQIKDSPVKKLRQRQIQRQRAQRIRRMNPQPYKKQSQVELIDPLSEQLKQYKEETSFKQKVQTSKASENLKKYIVQQEKNLRCLRMERMDRRDRITSMIVDNKSTVNIKNLNNVSSIGDLSANQGASLVSNNYRYNQPSNNLVSSRSILNMESLGRDDQKYIKQINIPKIEDVFKNQSKQYFLFENRMLRNQIGKIKNKIDENVIKSKVYSNLDINGAGRSSTSRMYMSVGSKDKQKQHPINIQNINDQYLSPHQAVKNNLGESHKESQISKSFQDMELDEVIEKRLKMSQNLRKMLYSQKKAMQEDHSQEFKTEVPKAMTQELQNLSFLLPFVVKPKQKVKLQGVKSYVRRQNGKLLRLTPASHLLFEMHRLSNQKQRKQSELTGLLKNSYQNRDSILSEKSLFYDQQSPFTDLSPSHQFRLRQIMNRKLSHRLQLSKQQVNNFIQFIRQIKQQFHVILNETVLKILKQVRERLLKGKVVKKQDLEEILEGKDQNELQVYPGDVIVERLRKMMI